MSTEEDDKPNLSTADIGAAMGLGSSTQGAAGAAGAADETRKESRERKKAARAEEAKQVTKTDKSTQDKLAEGRMLEKMQEGMAGMTPGAQPSPTYQLEPEQEFRNRTQGYVRALMNLGGKQG